MADFLTALEEQSPLPLQSMVADDFVRMGDPREEVENHLEYVQQVREAHFCGQVINM